MSNNIRIIMTLYQFEDSTPILGEDSYVASTAEVIGDVKIGNNCYIGPGAKIRGDYGRIRIGNRTSIQENCVLHAGPDQVAIIGDNVTIGHGAIVYGPTIHNNVIIGMGAIVNDHAVIHDWCLIAAGSLVTGKQIIQEESLVVGVPAKFVRKISKTNHTLIEFSANLYAELAPRYLAGLKKLAE
ncbi:gamma carbonic anhydrase family protein [Candidatus Heimdallarchaeota archaeon B3_Heim]|nr:MAG: gamma carbonic anhydrase family protein [Candidatus Heimdallarchaeota archaeon B3_Heim]